MLRRVSPSLLSPLRSSFSRSPRLVAIAPVARWLSLSRPWFKSDDAAPPKEATPQTDASKSTPQAPPPSTEPQTQKAQDLLAQKEKRIAELQDGYLRSLADTENLRQRHAKELASASTNAIQSFAKDLLETADVLTMAINAVPEADKEVKAVKDFMIGMHL